MATELYRLVSTCSEIVNKFQRSVRNRSTTPQSSRTPQKCLMCNVKSLLIEYSYLRGTRSLAISATLKLFLLSGTRDLGKSYFLRFS